MGNNKEINTIFKSSDILKNYADALTLRIDYYSQPILYEVFWKVWRRLVDGLNLSFDRYDFRRLNEIEIRKVNIDAVAESLGNSLEDVMVEQAYVIHNICRLFHNNTPQKPSNSCLIVSRYFLCIQIEKEPLTEDLKTFFLMMFEIIRQFGEKRIISPVKTELSISTIAVIAQEAIDNNIGVSANHLPKDSDISNYLSSYTFRDVDLTSVITNKLGKLNVNNEMGARETVWRDERSAIISYDMTCHTSPLADMENVFYNMLEKSEKHIELCANI